MSAFSDVLSLSMAAVLRRVVLSYSVALDTVEVVVVSCTGQLQLLVVSAAADDIDDDDEDADEEEEEEEDEEEVECCSSVDNEHELVSILTWSLGRHVACLTPKSGRKMSSTKNLVVLRRVGCEH